MTAPTASRHTMLASVVRGILVFVVLSIATGAAGGVGPYEVILFLVLAVAAGVVPGILRRRNR